MRKGTHQGKEKLAEKSKDTKIQHTVQKIMPGENCAIVECSTNRRHKDISLFKLPTAKPNDETTMSWSKAMLNVISRETVVDSDFGPQINNGKVYVCERHFLPGDLYICKFISKLAMS